MEAMRTLPGLLIHGILLLNRVVGEADKYTSCFLEIRKAAGLRRRAIIPPRHGAHIRAKKARISLLGISNSVHPFPKRMVAGNYPRTKVYGVDGSDPDILGCQGSEIVWRIYSQSSGGVIYSRLIGNH
jgi:hypothetical protein